MAASPLRDLEFVRGASARHCFALQGDLALLDADATIVPTDAFGRVERHWVWAVGLAGPHEARQLDHAAADLQKSGFVWVPNAPAGSVLAVNVAGMQGWPSVEEMITRFSGALEELERAHLKSEHRARPLVSMPLIGVGKAGMGGRTGEVITAILDAIDRHFLRFPQGNFDTVIVTRDASSIAALQHERRRRCNAKGLSATPEWLQTLVDSAKAHELAVMFGAGASASLGLPMWSGLLSELVDSLDDPELRRMNLADLDPTDAATLLIEAGIEAGQEEWFQESLQRILATEHHALTHGLIANLYAPLVLTTNYDQAFELAAEAIDGVPTTVLPWDADQGGSRILKLHGDLTRGQLVLSRDQFVAMHAFRRPLAGVLQSHMLIGHLLTIGTSMSDATLVHAAEEFRALINQARNVDGDQNVRTAGTVMLTGADPARVRLLNRSFTVVVGDAGVKSSDSARDVDVLLDWLAMQVSDDLSFALDERYEGLLSADDQVLAQQLRSLAIDLAREQNKTSDLARFVSEFLRSLGVSDDS